MGAALDDAAVVENEDQVGVDDRGQPVRDRQRRAVLRDPLEFRLDRLLRLRVERGRGLVEDQDARILEHGARDRDPLLFAARELEAALAHRRFIALRRADDELVDLRQLRGGDDIVVRRAGAAVGDVVFDRVVEEHGILRDDADRRAHAVLAHRADVAPVDRDAPAGDVVEAEQEARQRALPRAGRTDDGDGMARRNGEAHVEQDLAVLLVAEVDVLEAHLAATDIERRGARRIGDFRVLLGKREHPLHVGERLLDLAVEHAQEVERDVELDHERVDEHEVADRHRPVDDAHRRPPHDERYRDRDDRALRDVEQRQRGLAFYRRRLPALHALVVAARLPLLVAEILDRLVVEQAVDGARVGLRVELVHLPPEAGPPVGDHHGRRDVERERGDRDRDERPVVTGDEDGADEADLDQRGQDREQREADQRRDAALAALDVAREPAGLALRDGSAG